MIHGSVPANELDPNKGLRAQDYLIDPSKTATNLVKSWLKGSVMGDVTTIRSKPMKHLIKEVTHAIRIAYERGQERGSRPSMTLTAAGPPKLTTGVELAVKVLKNLNEEQRMEVFGEFCTFCGGDPKCTCMRDD